MKKENISGIIKKVCIAAFLLILSSFIFSHKASADVNTPAKDARTPPLLSAIRFVEIQNLYLGGMALDDQGGVWTWGYNAHGMMGAGDTNLGSYQGGMKRINYFSSNDIKITNIYGGYHTAYALSEDGRFFAWGRGAGGSMGNGTVTDGNPTPLEVTYFKDDPVVMAAPGSESAGQIYVITESGKVYAWGTWADYRIAQLMGVADPNKMGAAMVKPYLISDLTEINAQDEIISMDLGDLHGLIATKSGKIYSFGSNLNGQTGLNTTAGGVTTATEIPYFKNNNIKIKEVAANTTNSLALSQEGLVYEFGNVYGQGAPGYVTTPQPVGIDTTSAAYLPIFTQIEAGRYGQFALDQYGRIWSWGDNRYYQWGVEGPLFPTNGGLYDWTNSNIGKHTRTLARATQIPKEMGDGDTQEQYNSTMYNPKGPVFSDKRWVDLYLSLGEFAFNGTWTAVDGLHPTIYDKKYMKTVGDYASNTQGSQPAPEKHAKVFPVDAKGRRLVYIVLGPENGLYSGNFYVAEDSYSGNWIYSTAQAKLPAGVTSETSVPEVKDEEKNWIELSTGGVTLDYTGTQFGIVPYITNLSTYQSSTLLIDKAGNLYKTALDGSGSIAWGWDINNAYDAYNNQNKFGLYDKYVYEIVFMRGAPQLRPSEVTIHSPIKKIYKSDLVQEQASSIEIKIGEGTYNEQLDFTLEPELTQAKYVIIPYDPDDSNFDISSPSPDEFKKAYENGSYQTGDLIDLNKDNPEWGDLKANVGDPEINLTDNTNIVVKDNCILWVMSEISGYSAKQTTISRKVYDNYYTDTTLKHDGVNSEAPNEKIYSETEKNIKKTDSSIDTDDEDKEKYGIPLDVNGNVISKPHYGYDEVNVRAFAPGDPEYDLYINGWYLLDSSAASVNFTLKDKKYLIDDSSTPAKYYVHTFEYKRDPAGWVTITYRGRYHGTTENISPFDMKSIQSASEQIWFTSAYQETVKKTTTGSNGVTITQERVPVTIDNGQVMYYTVDGTKKKLNSAGNLEFETISDRNSAAMEVIIYYSKAEIYARQVIHDANDEVVVPSEGYLGLNLTNGTTTAETFNLRVNSGDDKEAVAFKHMTLTTAPDSQKFLIEPIIPQMYKYYGFSVSTTEAGQGSAAIDTTNDPIIDYSAESKYYVTVYLTPTISDKMDVPFYNWDYKLNDFGSIRIR